MKATEREADYSSESRVEVKNVWGYNSTPPYVSYSDSPLSHLVLRNLSLSSLPPGDNPIAVNNNNYYYYYYYYYYY